MNLKLLAYKLRKDTVDLICAGKAGHIGGDMSVMEVLVELYFHQMNISPENMDEMNSGSLGHGLPVCVGMAKAGKMDNRDYRVYTVMGDGELAEGSVGEGAMAASHYKLDNLCAVVDRNRLQISGNTEDVMHHDDLHERFKSFGWHVIDVADGNDIDQLEAAFNEAKTVKGKPTVLIANTIKGKGSKVMEDKANWHHKVPTEEEYAQIMADFKKVEEALQ